MILRACVLLLSAALAPGLAVGRRTPVLRQVAAIPLPGVEGRIDHMAADVTHNRLFIAALGNRTVEVVDLSQGRRVRTLGGWTEPQGICFVPETRRLFVSDANGECTILDSATLQRLGTVRFGEDADNLRLGETSRRVYVGFGCGGIGIVDARSGDKVGMVRLPAHPESFQLERNGDRVFVNVPGAGEIAVIDSRRGSIIAHWRLAGAGASFPMALDEDAHRLFIGCRRPGRLLIYDSREGRLLQSLPLCGDADDLFYDDHSGRLYASCGDGFLQAFGQRGGQYESLGRTATALGARTSLLVPDLGRLYLAVPHRGAQRAEIRIYELGPRRSTTWGE